MCCFVRGSESAALAAMGNFSVVGSHGHNKGKGRAGGFMRLVAEIGKP